MVSNNTFNFSGTAASGAALAVVVEADAGAVVIAADGVVGCAGAEVDAAGSLDGADLLHAANDRAAATEAIDLRCIMTCVSIS